MSYGILVMAYVMARAMGQTRMRVREHVLPCVASLERMNARAREHVHARVRTHACAIRRLTSSLKTRNTSERHNYIGP